MRTDGIIATVVIMDYLKHLTNNVSYTYKERDSGHGVNHEDIDDNTDLLIVVDSSSSQYEEIDKLSKEMDIIVIDHHNIEGSNNELNAILVNPKQYNDEYPNKNLSGSGVVWKFVEAIDYYYKKVNVHNYLDLIATSILSDSMRVDVLENRWIVKKGLENIRNAGLLSLIHETKNADKTIDSQIMNFNIIPVLNTTTRNNEMYKAFALLFEKDFFKAKEMSKVLVKDNKTRKDTVKKLMKKYEDMAENESFIYVVTKEAEKNYNGLVSQKLASTYKKPALVLKDNGETYDGSARSFNGFDLQQFLKQCPYVNHAAGHSEALGVSIDKNNWNKFKEYVNENIDSNLFEPVITYDIELNESDLTWDVANAIMEFDHIWGNGSDKIKVRLNNIFVEEKEQFPPSRKEHLKIKADNIDLLKFNNPNYASDVDDWDVISCVGDISINDYKGVLKLQLFMEDYKID